MYKLIIAEKNSAAQSIAQALLPHFTQKKGYIEGGSLIITHAVGHLIGLAEPELYDEKFKRWNLEDLPIIPSTFKLAAHKATFAQLKIIKELAQRQDVTEIVDAADSGREGEQSLIGSFNIYVFKSRSKGYGPAPLPPRRFGKPIKK
jgi:DNA topoisomerase III